MTAEINSSQSESTVCTTADPIPNTLGPKELMRVLGLPQATFYQHQRAGKFDRFLLPRPIGVKRYSGRLIEAYLSGRKA